MRKTYDIKNGNVISYETNQKTLSEFVYFAKNVHNTFQDWYILIDFADTSILAEAYVKAAAWWNGGTDTCMIPSSEAFYIVLKKILSRSEWDNPEEADEWINAIY